MTTIVKGSELRLADVVRLNAEAFADAVVSNITDKEIFFFRPYATTADFSYTGGVIPYIGIEQFRAYAKDADYVLVRRGGPLR